MGYKQVCEETRTNRGGSYIPLEKRVPQDHPLRRVGEMTDRGLQELSGWFDQLYAQMGRPAIPAEQRLRAHITGVRIGSGFRGG